MTKELLSDNLLKLMNFASFPGHSKIFPIFSPWLQNKIWEWPGDEAIMNWLRKQNSIKIANNVIICLAWVVTAPLENLELWVNAYKLRNCSWSTLYSSTDSDIHTQLSTGKDWSFLHYVTYHHGCNKGLTYRKLDTLGSRSHLRHSISWTWGICVFYFAKRHQGTSTAVISLTIVSWKYGHTLMQHPAICPSHSSNNIYLCECVFSAKTACSVS